MFTKTRKQALPTSAVNKSTNVTISWPFSSRLPKTIIWPRKWTEQPPGSGMEHGVHEGCGGKPFVQGRKYRFNNTAFA